MWKPISDLGERSDKKMFVVIAKGSPYPQYTTDPYCVWKDMSGVFVRWPHLFPPTHFCELPTTFSEEN